MATKMDAVVIAGLQGTSIYIKLDFDSGLWAYGLRPQASSQ
jgi:hypothetical protein